MDREEKERMLREIGKYIAEQIERKTKPLTEKLTRLEVEVKMLRLRAGEPAAKLFPRKRA
jgi:hypothetical protein